MKFALKMSYTQLQKRMLLSANKIFRIHLGAAREED